MNQDDNELLTKIGPGTRMGELMRRYWWPVGFSQKVTKKPELVRILGEDLVLFRDGTGKTGLVQRHCPHRRASLEFGRVEDKGIRCCYHGWLFSASGQCLEMPAEPVDSALKNQVKLRAYKTQEAAGLVFAYMGPDPVPLLPPYDLLARTDMDRETSVSLDQCNWLQRAENGADPAHSMALHASVYPTIALKHPNITYDKTWYGMRFDVNYEGARKNVFHMLFPSNTRRFGARVGDKRPAQYLHLRVPVDDYNTYTYIIEAVDAPKERAGTDSVGEISITPNLPYERIEDGWWGIASSDQDRVAQESQGVIVDRTQEILATSDRGVAMLRQMLFDSLKAIDNGQDPMGIVRDSNSVVMFDAQKNFVDTDKDFTGKKIA
jgi:5,5'-dehydrodivanillate O-demethylase